MTKIKLVAAIVIGLGAFSLSAPMPATAMVDGLACCTSGDGLHECCGETCSATSDSCTAECTVRPLLCLPT